MKLLRKPRIDLDGAVMVAAMSVVLYSLCIETKLLLRDHARSMVGEDRTMKSWPGGEKPDWSE